MAWVPTAAELLTIAHGTLGNTKVADPEGLAAKVAAGAGEDPLHAAAVTMQAILAADPCERPGETAALAVEVSRVVMYLNGLRVGRLDPGRAAEVLVAAPAMTLDELAQALRGWLS